MGVYNPNMKMPENCDQCPISNCSLDNGWLDYPTRPLGCPLIYVPEHGRLIDADALIKSLSLDEDDAENGASLLMAIFIEVLKAAPTIIPSDKESGE